MAGADEETKSMALGGTGVHPRYIPVRGVILRGILRDILNWTVQLFQQPNSVAARVIPQEHTIVGAT